MHGKRKAPGRGAPGMSSCARTSARSSTTGPALPAAGWRKGIDGMVGWAALVEGRLVVSRGPDGLPQPVPHAEAWEAGPALHTALAQHPANPDDEDDLAVGEDEPDGKDYGLLSDIRTRVRRRTAGRTLCAIEQVPQMARDDEQAAALAEGIGREGALAHAAAVREERQRIREATAAAGVETKPGAESRSPGPYFTRPSGFGGQISGCRSIDSAVASAP
ncbi:hypothetical protein ACWGB8_12735 [Kitasatospora sp. NPDC054939]